MNRRFAVIACFILMLAALTGCRTQSRLNLAPKTGGSAFLFKQFQAYDGDAGRPLSFSQLVRKCRAADVVLFGEEHGDSVCCQLEAQLLHALFNDRRPCALAMEFFEADVQADLDAYLAGRLSEPDFLDLARRRPSYLKTHRPLIELCRAAKTPVIAANAPRRLVTAYRKSGQDYADFRADLPPEDARWLPTENVYIAGDYRDRFAATMEEMHAPTPPATMPAPETAEPPAEDSATVPPAETMAPASQPESLPASMPATPEMPASMPELPTWQELYAAQLLWDQAMSESLARHRTLHGGDRLMLVVGKYHVAQTGGLLQKFRAQRPDDRVVTVIFSSTSDTSLPFDESGVGDVIIRGLTPPAPPREMPAMPVAESSEPASQPAESMEVNTQENKQEIPAENPEAPPVHTD